MCFLITNSYVKYFSLFFSPPLSLKFTVIIFLFSFLAGSLASNPNCLPYNSAQGTDPRSVSFNTFAAQMRNHLPPYQDSSPTNNSNTSYPNNESYGAGAYGSLKQLVKVITLTWR